MLHLLKLILCAIRTHLSSLDGWLPAKIAVSERITLASEQRDGILHVHVAAVGMANRISKKRLNLGLVGLDGVMFDGQILVLISSEGATSHVA